MKRPFRHAALHVLLAALLLRALMPLGWMPGSPSLGQGAFIICMADGQIQHGTPGKDESGKHEQPCAFAAAHAMAAPQAAALPAPSLTAIPDARPAAPALRRAAGNFTPQSPRAPPISA